MRLKFTAKIFDAIVANLRTTVDSIRLHERLIMTLCVEYARMPRKEFIESFQKNVANLE